MAHHLKTVLSCSWGMTRKYSAVCGRNWNYVSVIKSHRESTSHQQQICFHGNSSHSLFFFWCFMDQGKCKLKLSYQHKHHISSKPVHLAPRWLWRTGSQLSKCSGAWTLQPTVIHTGGMSVVSHVAGIRHRLNLYCGTLRSYSLVAKMMLDHMYSCLMSLWTSWQKAIGFSRSNFLLYCCSYYSFLL